MRTAPGPGKKTPALKNLRAVDSGQYVVIEFLPLELGVGPIAPGVGEQVYGKAHAVPLRPEEIALHPRPDVGGDGEYAPGLGPQTGPLPSSPTFVAPLGFVADLTLSEIQSQIGRDHVGPGEVRLREGVHA